MRHDDVLALLYSFVSKHIPTGHNATVDLPEEQYIFPQAIATTNSRPDMVIWNDQLTSIYLIELTIPFETGIEDAAERKRQKYADLLAKCSAGKRVAKLITIEVGSRGFINTESFDDLYKHLKKPSKKDCTN